MPVLKILTWNIWMMPSIAVCTSPRNKARAAAIARELLLLDYDILCLQKVFDDGAREVLQQALEAKYPYIYGPANDGPDLLRTNGGVWVLSRLPLGDYQQVEYRDSAGIEKFSRKGAMLLSGVVEQSRFQIVATHLQGDDAATFQADRQHIRNLQMKQLVEDLVKPYSDPFAPVFFCGDFCTPHRDEDDHFARTDAFDLMLATLEAETNDEERITLVADRAVNDIADDKSGRRAELDYILVKPNGTQYRGTWERLVIRHPGWDGGSLNDLSYRYAIGGTFVLG